MTLIKNIIYDRKSLVTAHKVTVHRPPL